MEGLIVTVEDGVKIIKLDRPQRKNAVNRRLYEKLTNILKEDYIDDTVVVTIITGEGEYFTSGNDMKDLMESEDPDAARITGNATFKEFIQVLINYPKLLIAVVNGPAIGIGATITGLCDIVYATEKATFQTPFVKLGLCCEGCSSYTFPIYMGRSKASEVLLLGRKLSAQEALQCNLVARVIPHEKLGQLFEELQSYGKLPLKSLMINKKLITDGFKNELRSCNKRECETLLERSGSDDFLNAVMQFLSRKSKL